LNGRIIVSTTTCDFASTFAVEPSWSAYLVKKGESRATLQPGTTPSADSDCAMFMVRPCLPRAGQPLARKKRPIFLPEMARWVRPTWLAAWVAMAYGAFVLLPSLLPLYGQRFPDWVWLGTPLMVLPPLYFAAHLDRRKRSGAYAWMVAGMAATGAAVVFALGLSIVITRPLAIWEQLAFGGFGVLCLVFLLGLDRIGFLAEKWAPADSRGFRLWGGRLVPESWVLLGFVLGSFLLLVATYLLVG
jgi:hypothetical protein